MNHFTRGQNSLGKPPIEAWTGSPLELNRLLVGTYFEASIFVSHDPRINCAPFYCILLKLQRDMLAIGREKSFSLALIFRKDVAYVWQQKAAMTHAAANTLITSLSSQGVPLTCRWHKGCFIQVVWHRCLFFVSSARFFPCKYKFYLNFSVYALLGCLCLLAWLLGTLRKMLYCVWCVC